MFTFKTGKKKFNGSLLKVKLTPENNVLIYFEDGEDIHILSCTKEDFEQIAGQYAVQLPEEEVKG